MRGGILSGSIDGDWRRRKPFPKMEASIGLQVTHIGSRFMGKVARWEPDGAMVLRSPNTGLERLFKLTPGAFSVRGEPVELIRPRPQAPASPPAVTASGSVAVRTRARVARRSRILVEGIHDAELVEKVWGDDLRAEGVVVERLDGADVLMETLDAFAPGPDARLGVLLDHLVPGSKESRIAEQCARADVMIVGTPFVDVWQAIRPRTVGIDAWPVVPRGQDWKTGICASFGEREPGRLWKRLLSRVATYADLEPELVGSVERLIDFVTAAEG